MEKVGALALVGSGEYLPVMEPLEGALLNRAISRGRKNHFVQLPTAAGQEGTKSLTYWESMGAAQSERLDSKQVFLPVFNREDAMNEDYAEQIDGAGLIYLSGGDPTYLAATLLDTPVWQAIVKNWHKGSSLAGCSAGAMALAKDVPHFMKLKSEGDPGLNLISNIRVIPHYNKFFGWIPDGAAKVLLQAPEGVVVIGIDESTALVTGLHDESTFEAGIWEVHGFAGVHILRGAPTHRYQEGDRIPL
ncbi:MAG: Type 1 glutamine amidotransferase-like domain-containing protein [Actinomycetes bacterium]|jgi:cyanophycinase